MAEEKRIFQILDEMNIEDGKNNTRLVAVSTHFIGADKVKQGTKVSMGADAESIFDLMQDKVMPLLLLVNKEEYFKRNKQEHDGGWISVEKEKPELGKGVLIHLASGFMTVAYRKKEEEGYAWQVFGDKDYVSEPGDFVTHWMPLPKPPEV